MVFFIKRNRRKYLRELEICRHAEDDQLTPKARRDFDAIISNLANAPVDKIPEAMVVAKRDFSKLSFVTNYGKIRNLLDLLLVVGSVAFGIRGLFFQPFRIPTSSMQPTLYGIHYLDTKQPSNPWLNRLPTPLVRILFAAVPAWVQTVENGTFDVDSISEQSGLLFNYTNFKIGDQRYKLPGTSTQVRSYAELFDPYRGYKKGEVLANGWVTLGDHLFVERMSMYISPPKRGDVLVFNTENLKFDGRNLIDSSGFYYIKRLAALPGDTVKIMDEQLFVRPAGQDKFQPIQKLVPAFAKVYSGQGGYQGHSGMLGKFEYGAGGEYTLPKDHYYMLGDNSAFSLDSRFFGGVPRRNLVGRAWIVFYPFTRRCGLVDNKPPLNAPTGTPRGTSFPVMYRQ